MSGETCEVCFSYIPDDQKVSLQGGHVLCACCSGKGQGALRRMWTRSVQTVRTMVMSLAILF